MAKRRVKNKDKKMKVVFIGQKGIPTLMGGIERHVEELTIRLAKQGHDVIVYTRPNYSDKKLNEYKGVRLVSLPSLATKHLDAISHTFFACLDVSFRRDIDVIHFHSIGPSFFIWLAKLLNPLTPVVATFHSQCYYHKKWGKFAKFSLKVGEYVCCKFPDRLITVSKNLRRYVLKKYGVKASYVPNGVPNYSPVKPDEIKKRGLEKGSYIFYGGRLIRHKGLHYLIEAFSKVRTDKRLVISGEGMFTDNYEQELKHSAQKDPRVMLIGRIDGTSKELAELFSNAYIYAHPTEAEGLSISLLETMSYGVVPLISNIPENLEAVEQAGFVFESGNVEDLRGKLQHLIDNPDEVRSKEMLGKERVEECYSWDVIAEDIANVYRDAQSECRFNLRKCFKFK
ncbi:MAG: glycosyltransferase family 4 protein [Patescibacteria group bacterium]|nr:glycosyltransferase family 4 protein [Patescibacteria group bacterium]